MTARVLVVDDVLANVRLLEAKLAAEYFEVITAMNGVDALENVARAKPDIVLLDVMMPGIDGVEVCKRIKENPQTQHIPVVMFTALDQPEDRVRGEFQREVPQAIPQRPVNDHEIASLRIDEPMPSAAAAVTVLLGAAVGNGLGWIGGSVARAGARRTPLALVDAPTQPLGVDLADRLAVDMDLAGIGCFEPGQHSEQ